MHGMGMGMGMGMLTFGYICISAIFISDPMFKEHNNAASFNSLRLTKKLGGLANT